MSVLVDSPLCSMDARGLGPKEGGPGDQWAWGRGWSKGTSFCQGMLFSYDGEIETTSLSCLVLPRWRDTLHVRGCLDVIVSQKFNCPQSRASMGRIAQKWHKRNLISQRQRAIRTRKPAKAAQNCGDAALTSISVRSWWVSAFRADTLSRSPSLINS